MKKVTKLYKRKLRLEVRFILSSDTHAIFTILVKEEKFIILGTTDCGHITQFLYNAGYYYAFRFSIYEADSLLSHLLSCLFLESFEALRIL